MDRQNVVNQAEQRKNQRRHRTAQVEMQIKQEHYQADMIQSKERADLELSNTQRHNDKQVAHESRVAIQHRSNLNAERTDEHNHIQERERVMYEAAHRTSHIATAIYLAIAIGTAGILITEAAQRTGIYFAVPDKLVSLCGC
jgi:hypothetical protein